ncbi:polyketide biosynthesis acyl carrier protein [Thermoflavimicrobium dichotomicum]|uniref:Polyketide biosynthesis acyl carrier protein n=2 Tax=Thermoflavimicrobium dichotomicum TaxID=46223 RepID=A0A1I3VBT7_9BACL|nr:polyketide biosynthesis acyl carrier protein [Thermoflavimicrobium dichotomicum]
MMNKEDIFRLVVEHTREVLPELEEYNIQPNDRLVDLGANSVDRAEIIMRTMESLSLKVPRVELFGAKNIEELVELLYEKIQSV